MDGLEQNHIFTNQQGGRYKTFGLTIGLTDQNGMVINPDELRAMLGGRSRIPLHVSLFYSSEKDGTSKMVESKVAVGGTLKGEPLLEVKDNNGMLVSADSITPFLAVDCLTRMCIRINDVSKSHMNRRFCVRLSTLPELTVENGLSAAILVRSKLVPSKKRAKLEDPNMDMGGGKRSRGDAASAGPGPQAPISLPQLASGGSSGSSGDSGQSAQLDALKGEVTYLRSILTDIQKHILTPAGITAFSPNGPGAAGAGAAAAAAAGAAQKLIGGAGVPPLPSSAAAAAASALSAAVTGPGSAPSIAVAKPDSSSDAKAAPAEAGASQGAPAAAKLFPAGGESKKSGDPSPATSSRASPAGSPTAKAGESGQSGSSFTMPVSRNTSASVVSATTASSPPSVSSPPQSTPDALVQAAALVDKAGESGADAEEANSEGSGSEDGEKKKATEKGGEGKSATQLKKDAELVQMIRSGSKDGSGSDSGKN